MKTYLLIGGTSGIGKELREKLLSQEAEVYLLSRSAEELDAQENLFTKNFDVLNDEFPIEFLPETLNGMAYLPGSINLNAFKQFKDEDYIQDYKLNVLGAVNCVKACHTALRKADTPGSVVFFSSTIVQTGMPFHAIVAASKGALEGLTRNLAAEFAPKIRVNAIAPSLTDTPLASRITSNEKTLKNSIEKHPLKRIGHAQDIAHAAAFLLGDESAWITGQILKVDGGISSIKL